MFDDPLRFDPGRWASSRGEGQRGEGTGFRSLAFGFGARQCVGRRIAENEMQLLLMHVSDGRQEEDEGKRRSERNGLMPEKRHFDWLQVKSFSRA